MDFANSTGVFHAKQVPEAPAMTLAERPMSELRAKAREAGWKGTEQVNPKYAGELKALFSKGR